jgi:hypothetical protein
MNMGFAGGGGQLQAGGGAPRRKWYSPEIESLLAAKTLAATLWSNGVITDAVRDKMLDRVETNLKRAGYGERFPEQPGKRNPWKGKSRGRK